MHTWCVFVYVGFTICKSTQRKGLGSIFTGWTLTIISFMQITHFTYLVPSFFALRVFMLYGALLQILFGKVLCLIFKKTSLRLYKFIENVTNYVVSYRILYFNITYPPQFKYVVHNEFTFSTGFRCSVIVYCMRYYRHRKDALQVI